MKPTEKGSLRYWQDKLIPKYLETPSQEEMVDLEETDSQLAIIISVLAAFGSICILTATFLAMAWIINIIL